MKTIDLGNLKVITGKDIEGATRAGATEIRICQKAVITPTARDYIRSAGIVLIQTGASTNGGAPKTSCSCSGTSCSCSDGRCTCPPGKCSCDNCSNCPAAVNGASCPKKQAAAKPAISSSLKAKAELIFNSPEATAIKEEILKVGRKLWQREYVDGNGGNISYRISEDFAICTPTLMSKGDMTIDDLCLVDLEGNQVAGTRPRTSEILMHLEIYKGVPEAKAVVHCHPPHATAYAITGMVPPNCIIPEAEVFIGAVALSPYDTPGTKSFAEMVVPYAKNHNTILLANHGIVCWGDTVTHAEWYAEVVDTYCRTLMLAAQLGSPITKIPGDKTAALLDIKKKIGLPDARFGAQECSLCDLPEFTKGIIVSPKERDERIEKSCDSRRSDDIETLIRQITDQVMAALNITE